MFDELGSITTSHATGQCLLPLRDTDLRENLKKIRTPILIHLEKKDKICSYQLANN